LAALLPPEYQTFPSHDPNFSSGAGSHHPEGLLPIPQTTDDVPHLPVDDQNHSQQSEPFEMLLSVQPPMVTQPGHELYPPFAVQVLNPTMDLQNVSALATMYKDGKDVTNELLHGTKFGVYSKEKFSFSGLSIPKRGHYYFKISLYHRGVVVNCVETDRISVGDRPFLRAARETQQARRQLLWQIVDANFQDDNTGQFPEWKTHTSSSIISLGKIDFDKVMVFVPVSDFVRENIDDGFYEISDGLGDGLFTTEDGLTWGDDGEVEWVDSQNSSIRSGTDGLMYRRQAGFRWLYVALERRVAIVDGSLCIAHIVLL
jgi:hypothetical protein